MDLKSAEIIGSVPSKYRIHPAEEEGRLFTKVGSFQSAGLENRTVGRSDGEGQPEKRS